MTSWLVLECLQQWYLLTHTLTWHKQLWFVCPCKPIKSSQKHKKHLFFSERVQPLNFPLFLKYVPSLVLFIYFWCRVWDWPELQSYLRLIAATITQPGWLLTVTLLLFLFLDYSFALSLTSSVLPPLLSPSSPLLLFTYFWQLDRSLRCQSISHNDTHLQRGVLIMTSNHL